MTREAPITLNVRDTLRPGDAGRIISLHGTGYREENAHFGLLFEAYVAHSVADFIIEDQQAGRVWLAEQGERLVGCSAMIDRGEKGQLRWVVVDPSVRGRGLGTKLIDGPLEYARGRGWSEIYLETTPGLDTSYEMYVRRGFEMSGQPRDWIDSQQMIVMRKSLTGEAAK